jgi:hypothetical protein
VTLRILVRTNRMQNDGADYASFKTFDVDHPEIERFLKDGGYNEDSYLFRQVIGVEVVDDIPRPSRSIKEGENG